jgi:hypothetical protein
MFYKKSLRDGERMVREIEVIWSEGSPNPRKENTL